MRKNIVKLFVLMFCAFFFPFSIRAVTTSIRLYTKGETKSYVAGVKVTYMMSSDDKYSFYSLDNKAVKNVIIYPMDGISKDGGLVYILQNGYPNQSITGDKDKDYYITQTAIWWYRDLVNGTNNLNSNFKVGGADSYHIRYKIKNLATEGYSHRNDSILDQEMNFVLGVSEHNKMVLKDHYYVSNDIKAVENKNMNRYTITLSNAPKGTIIVYSSGVEEVYSKEFTLAASDSFRIKVPLASLSGTKTSIQVNAMGEGNTHFVVKEYQPTSSPSVSNMVISLNASEAMASNTSLEIASSKVTISKIDASTQQPLAGAKLTLKDSNGKVLSTWTSTINAHVFHNLASGTYTIEEVEAPNGYEKNTVATKFTISDNHYDIKVVIENQVKKSVVTITKVDQANHPLSGAVLLVKRSDGSEVARFTTTESSHTLMDLVDGIYTVEEISAPPGYIKSNEKITFQIDANHLSHQINFVNAKEVVVPDTASFSSILFFLLGAIMITSSGVFIYRYGKRI